MTPIIQAECKILLVMATGHLSATSFKVQIDFFSKRDVSHVALEKNFSIAILDRLKLFR